jgi:hypothetical protein
MPAGGEPYTRPPIQVENPAAAAPTNGGATAAPAKRGGGAGGAGSAQALVPKLLQALEAAPPEEFSAAMQDLAAGVQAIAERKFGGQVGPVGGAPQPVGAGLPTAVPSAPTPPDQRMLNAA